MDDELEEIMKQVAPAAPPLKRVCCLKSFKTLDSQSRAEYDNYANLMEVTATLLLPGFLVVFASCKPNGFPTLLDVLDFFGLFGPPGGPFNFHL